MTGSTGPLRPRSWTASLALTLFLTAALARASAPQLLNINSNLIPQGSYPLVLGDLGGKIIFGARDGTGSGVWSTDGTTAGTALLARFPHGAAGVFGSANQVTALKIGATLYFAAGDVDGGTVLWKTDGTASGTVEFSGPCSGPPPGNIIPIGVFGSQVVFQSYAGSAGPWQLCITDGTAAGTKQLTNLAGQRAHLGSAIISAADNSKFYFSGGTDYVTGKYIYVSDGTPAGTHPVANPFGGSSGAVDNPINFVQVGSLILYSSGRDLWSIDPSTDTIGSVVAFTGSVGIGQTVATFTQPGVIDMNGYILFLGASPTSMGTQLWRSDGTTAGTYPLGITDNGTLPDLQYNFIVKVGGHVLFLGKDATNGVQIWTGDGAAGNTHALTTNIPQQTAPEPVAYPAGVVNGVAYFVIPDATAGSTGFTLTLWKTDGATPLVKVAGIPPLTSLERGYNRVIGDASITYLSMWADANDPLGGTTSLYRYDGSSAATLLKTGLRVDLNTSFFFDTGRLFFADQDAQIGEEPWISDGTAAGTALLKDINPQTIDASASPNELVNLSGKVAFAADDGVAGRELWTSDGTTAGTRLLADVNPGPNPSNPNHLYIDNGDLFFFATDSTYTSRFMRLAAGASAPDVLATLTAQPVSPGPPPSYAFSTCGGDGSVTLGGTVYFPANDGSGFKLWKSDGTVAGTTLVAPAATANPCWLTVLGAKLYFSGYSAAGAGELWVSDGTAAGTAAIADVSAAPNGQAPLGLGVLNGVLYFTAGDTAHGFEVWKSDGTAAGTTQLTHLSLGANSYVSATGVLNGQLLLFSTAPDPQHAGTLVTQLWVTGGTTSAPTALATSVSPSLVIASGLAYFSSTASGAPEPWVTDGTAAGTHALLQLPGSPTTVTGFVNFNGVVLFDVVDSAGTTTVWRTDGTTAGTAALTVAPQLDNPFNFSSTAFTSLVVGQQYFFRGVAPTTGTELYVLTNNAPTAVADSATSADDAAVTVNVLTNDTDSDGTLVATSVKVTSGPSHGTATVNSSGAIVYQPTSGYAGSDSFAYTVADNQGAGSAPAVVTVTVTAPTVIVPATSTGGKSGGGGALGLTELLVLLSTIAMCEVRHRRRRPASDAGLKPFH
jgi:ELWxxDGT repeat protein